MLSQPLEKRTQTAVEPLAGEQILSPPELEREFLVESVASFFVFGIFFRCCRDQLEHLVASRLEELNGLLGKQERDVLGRNPPLCKKHRDNFPCNFANLDGKLVIVLRHKDWRNHRRGHGWDRRIDRWRCWRRPCRRHGRYWRNVSRMRWRHRRSLWGLRGRRIRRWHWRCWRRP